ncbi:MAG TPA: sigma-70 family RNA polymerase sigma factor [Phycisphaerae bacterium]|nr:sigma-70 family RNA polymerase sigma factor [Phycisphaerae bacterium]
MTEGGGQSRREWIREALARYEGPLVRYAARITGDPESARDVVQEAFGRLCGEDASDLNGRVGPWLFAVCRNRALDVRRKERRMTTATTSVLEGVADAATDPAIAASDREEAGGVLRLLNRLPESQQEAIRLKFQEGMSYRQISEVTGHSVSHVGVLIHEGMKALRARLCRE